MIYYTYFTIAFSNHEKEGMVLAKSVEEIPEKRNKASPYTIGMNIAQFLVHRESYQFSSTRLRG